MVTGWKIISGCGFACIFGYLCKSGRCDLKWRLI